MSAGVGLVWNSLTLDVAYVHAYAPREPAARVLEIAQGEISGSDETLTGFRQDAGKAQFTSHQLFISAIIRF